MNWLRYVLLAVCILSALAGYRKGLVRTVLSMVSLILVTGLAIWMNPYVTDVLNERTTLPQYVEKKCLETFENNEFVTDDYDIIRGDLFLKISNDNKPYHYHEQRTKSLICVNRLHL